MGQGYASVGRPVSERCSDARCLTASFPSGTAARTRVVGAYCTAHLDGLAATSHPSLVVAARCMRAALITGPPHTNLLSFRGAPFSARARRDSGPHSSRVTLAEDCPPSSHTSTSHHPPAPLSLTVARLGAPVSSCHLRCCPELSGFHPFEDRCLTSCGCDPPPALPIIIHACPCIPLNCQTFSTHLYAFAYISYTCRIHAHTFSYFFQVISFQ